VSYKNGMQFGLIACRELVPDLDRMAGYLADELDTLAKAVAAA
jgi:diacylglycerol O-acyltransferase